jgi:decaprenyl-phosphate phosphoribosyltransferase
LIIHIFQACRPSQWIKQGLLFIAPVTAGSMGDWSSVFAILLSFISFSLIASCGYLINDWNDKDLDSSHPTKSKRAIAQGLLSGRQVSLMISALLLISFLLSTLLPHSHSIILVAYLVITVSYTLFLKVVPVIEMLVVSVGFLLRPLAGAAAISIPVSKWFLIVTSFGSLFLVASKRLSELRRVGNQPVRKVIQEYSFDFLNSVITLSIAITMTAYSLWAFGFQPRSVLIEISIGFVLTGMLRYLWVRDTGNGEAPEKLLFEDRILSLSGIAAFFCIVFAVYVQH